jgi:hypothetical protein
MRGAASKALTATSLGIVLSLVAQPVLAWEGEDGVKDCGSLIGKLRARYNDRVNMYPPGGPYVFHHWEDDGQWHVHIDWGMDGGGAWYAIADPNLDFAGTYPFCVVA